MTDRDERIGGDEIPIPAIIESIRKEEEDGTFRQVRREFAAEAIAYYDAVARDRYATIDTPDGPRLLVDCEHAAAAIDKRFEVRIGPPDSEGEVLADGFARIAKNVHGVFVEIRPRSLKIPRDRLERAAQTQWCTVNKWSHFVYRQKTGTLIDVYYSGTLPTDSAPDPATSAAPEIASATNWPAGKPLEGNSTPLGDLSACGLPKFVLSRNFGLSKAAAAAEKGSGSASESLGISRFFGPAASESAATSSDGAARESRKRARPTDCGVAPRSVPPKKVVARKSDFSRDVFLVRINDVHIVSL